MRRWRPGLGGRLPPPGRPLCGAPHRPGLLGHQRCAACGLRRMGAAGSRALRLESLREPLKSIRVQGLEFGIGSLRRLAPRDVAWYCIGRRAQAAAVARWRHPRSPAHLAGERHRCATLISSPPARLATDQRAANGACARRRHHRTTTSVGGLPARTPRCGQGGCFGLAGAGPIRGTLNSCQIGRFSRGNAGEQLSMARERGPENAGPKRPPR